MKTNRSDDVISILFCSDLHLGTYAVDQDEMTRAIRETIFPLIPDLDILFINGDFFDREVIFESCAFDSIYDVILNLFALCEIHQTKLRVLQGTWTHDRGQLSKFKTFYRNHHCTFDFRIIDNIELETISFQKRDLRFFYVPDDLPFSSSDDIAKVVCDKMQERGWEYVDYGCMHGFFDFTFPKNISQAHRIVYKKEQFPFVRKIINVGHVHQYRSDDFVYSNGSFDRSCHGDQDPKGCITVVDYPEHYTAHFVENKLAAVFDTVVIPTDADTETIVKIIKEYLSRTPTDRQIRIRFIVDRSEQYEAIKSWMKENHPDVKTVRMKSDDKEAESVMIPNSSFIVPLVQKAAPTRKTIANFIKDVLAADDPLTIEKIESYIEAAEV